MSFNDWLDVPYKEWLVHEAQADGDRCGYENETTIEGPNPPRPWTLMTEAWQASHSAASRRRDRHLKLVLEASELRDYDVPPVPEEVIAELERGGWFTHEKQRRARESGLLPPDSCF